jgi:hypothetical protein
MECKKRGKSTFLILFFVTSLMVIYRFLWEGVSQMLAYFLLLVHSVHLAWMVMADKMM